LAKDYPDLKHWASKAVSTQIELSFAIKTAQKNSWSNKRQIIRATNQQR